MDQNDKNFLTEMGRKFKCAASTMHRTLQIHSDIKLRHKQKFPKYNEDQKVKAQLTANV